MGSFWSTQATQESFLHHHVRVARVEIMDLMCDKLRLSHTPASYRVLESLEWVIGQKLTLPDGKIFWATDTDYQFTHGTFGRHRRDSVRLRQTENVQIVDGDDIVEKTTAQCCQLVCFFTVHGLNRLPAIHLPASVIANTHNDRASIHLMLCRFFEAHPQAISRDSDHRPVCPGPLHVNNCLG